jgi:hypothetical protein
VTARRYPQCFEHAEESLPKEMNLDRLKEMHTTEPLVRGSSAFNVLNAVTLLSAGHAVAQLVEALRFKLEGCGFDSRWCHWNFSLIQSFRPHYGSGVDSASNRNEYQVYLLGVKAAGT